MRDSPALADGEAHLRADRSHVALAHKPLLIDLADEWVLEEQDRYRDRLVDALGRRAGGAPRAGADAPGAARAGRPP